MKKHQLCSSNPSIMLHQVKSRRIPSRYLPLLFFFYTCQLFSQIPEKPYSNSHFIIVDSVRFHYRSWNDELNHPKGKIVLIHGFCGSTYCWRNCFDTLAASGYLVIAVDLPGFGYSDRNPDINQSQSNRARLLWDLISGIRKKDTGHWNIIGHSMGGGTAEAMALMHPEKTGTLIIEDGMVFINNTEMQGTFITLSKNSQYNKIFSAMVEQGIFTRATIKMLLHKNYRRTPDSADISNYLKPLLIEGTAKCVLNVWSNAKEIIHMNVKGINDLPVLVIWGKNDNTIYISSGYRFIRHAANAVMVVIPNGGHSPMETRPKLFNAAILNFLNAYNQGKTVN